MYILPEVGQRIRMLVMIDPDPIPKGTLGTVIKVSPFGLDDWDVSVEWDNGRTFGLALPLDTWEPFE